VNNEVID